MWRAQLKKCYSLASTSTVCMFAQFQTSSQLCIYASGFWPTSASVFIHFQTFSQFFVFMQVNFGH